MPSAKSTEPISSRERLANLVAVTAFVLVTGAIVSIALGRGAEGEPATQLDPADEPELEQARREGDENFVGLMNIEARSGICEKIADDGGSNGTCDDILANLTAYRDGSFTFPDGWNPKPPPDVANRGDG